MAKSTGGMRIANLPEWQTFFKILDHDITTDARHAFKIALVRIQRQAIAYAPVDEERLEESIVIKPYQGNQYFMRGTISVGGVVRGRDVSAYARLVHEYPWTKRGPKTVAKGPKSGPRYLARAMDEYKKTLIKDVSEVMEKGIKVAVSRSGISRKRSR